MSPVVVAFDEFEVDAARNELRRAGVPIKVDALVIDLLVYLTSRAGDLVTHEELIEHVWDGRAVSDNVVSVAVAKLRKALGHRRGERELVVNVYGRGYRFLPDVREVLRSRQSEPPAPLALGPRRAGAPFVGREPIMLRLRSALDGAIARKGSVCALLGEPGIGKTRIAEAIEQQAALEGVQVAWGRARELEGAPPFWPWVDVVRTLLAAVSAEAAALHLGPSIVELSRILPDLSSSGGGARDDEAARFRTFEAASRLLAFAGQKAPWLIVLDDMHRADAASLELLAYLVDEVARLPVIMVATLRSTERTRMPAEQRCIDYVLGHRNCERIEVVSLSQRDVAAYTEAFLGRADEALSRAVFSKSEGNAFFMTELLRELGETQASSELGALRGKGPAPELSLPAASLDLVRQRVRRVGDDVQPLLKAAAVLGRSFELALLSRVTGVPAAALLESLDDALATDFIVASPEDMGRFAFAHDLIRAVLYDGLPKAERAALHLRVARALVELEREGRYVPPAELAHHFLSAVPQGDVVRAVEYGERAADAAMGVAAYADAAAIVRRAHAALDLAKAPAPAVRCRLHYRMSVCLRVSDARESIAELRKSVALARENKLHDMLVTAGSAMVRAPGVVMIEDGRAVLEDALSGLPEDDHARRSTVLSHLAWCAPYSFDRAQSESFAARALAHARASGSSTALLVALRTQLYSHGGPCHAASERQRWLEEGDQLAAREHAYARALWANQSSAMRASFALQRGDRAGIEAALVKMGKSAHELQHAELIWHYDRIRIIDRMNRGAISDVGPQLRELRERGKAIQLFASDQVCGHDALVLMRQTVDISGLALSSVAQPMQQDSPAVLALKMRSSLELGRKDLAAPIFADFAQRGFAALPCDRDYSGVMSHLAHVAVALQQPDHAETIYGLLAPHAAIYSTDISFHTDGSIAHVLGLIARLLERRDAAIAHLQDAVRWNDALELRARATESRIELAATLLNGGTSKQRTLALELLAAAQTTASALKLAPLLARATALAT